MKEDKEETVLSHIQFHYHLSNNSITELHFEPIVPDCQNSRGDAPYQKVLTNLCHIDLIYK